MNAVEFAAKLSLFARFLRCGSAIGIDVTELVKKTLQDTLLAGEITLSNYQGGKNVPTLNNEEVRLGLEVGKLDAIKAYKNRTQLFLIDAKNAVETYFDKYGLVFKTYTY